MKWPLIFLIKLLYIQIVLGQYNAPLANIGYGARQNDLSANNLPITYPFKSVPISNNMPINMLPNSKTLPLNNLPVTQNIPLSPLTNNGLPTYRLPNNMPISNLPIAKELHNGAMNRFPYSTNYPIPNGYRVNNIPQINNLGVANNLPPNKKYGMSNHNLPNANNYKMINNAPVVNNFPFGNGLPISNNVPRTVGNNLPIVSNNLLNNNLPMSYNYPVPSNLPMVNNIAIPSNLPIVNNYPSIPNNFQVHNLPIPNPMANSLPTVNHFPMANNLPIANNYQIINDLPIPNNNKFNNIPSPRNVFIPNDNLPRFNNMPNYNNAILLPTGLPNFNYMPINANGIPPANQLPINFPQSNQHLNVLSFPNGVPNNPIATTFTVGNHQISNLTPVNGVSFENFISYDQLANLPNISKYGNNNLQLPNLSIGNDCDCNEPGAVFLLKDGFANSLSSTSSDSPFVSLSGLQLSGIGNLPLFNGMPVIGVKEKVINLSSL
ncbi:homeobox protein 4-like [Galleria mellonella]|uniref:Homeobox protein 4-like n=1 Tax=Galleria mellonella TaxID=7137 RepID=A0A6J3CCX4_GALME|nr:homeobox protein 4-like [Galleria mellonella]